MYLDQALDCTFIRNYRQKDEYTIYCTTTYYSDISMGKVNFSYFKTICDRRGAHSIGQLYNLG